MNLRRKDPNKYYVNELVAIKRTQLVPGQELKPKYLGPYRITKIKSNDTYDTKRVGSHEGPIKTTICAEFLKSWAEPDPDDQTSSGADNDAGGPSCGEATEGADVEDSFRKNVEKVREIRERALSCIPAI